MSSVTEGVLSNVDQCIVGYTIRQSSPWTQSVGLESDSSPTDRVKIQSLKTPLRVRLYLPRLINLTRVACTRKERGGTSNR